MYRAIVYENKKIIGYTNSYLEAEDICKIKHEYSWQLTKRKDMKNIKQIVISDY